MAVNLQTIKDIRNYLASELSGLYPEREMRSLINYLLSDLFDMNNTFSLLNENERWVNRKVTDMVIRYCSDLKAGKPVQYVTGKTIFYNCIIKVAPGVLIPRPETEELIDLVIKENRGFTGSIIDIGTGSGCIAIALAVNLPSSKVSGIDISKPAIKTAKENADMNQADILFLEADVLKIDPSEIMNVDIIVSNPPYVRNSEKQYMKMNVLSFEPHEALFVTDEDPLLFYRAILDLAVNILNPGGVVYFEINEAMGKEMHDLLEFYKYHRISIIKDLNGKDRIAKGEKND